MNGLVLTGLFLFEHHAQHLQHGKGSVGHTGLCRFQNLSAHTDDIFIGLDLVADALYIATCLNGFGTGVQQESGLPDIYLAHLLVNQAALVLQGVELADIPTELHAGNIIGTESALEHIQTGIAVTALHEQAQCGTDARTGGFLLCQQHIFLTGKELQFRTENLTARLSHGRSDQRFGTQGVHAREQR